VFYRHAGENRHPEGFEFPGFRVAPAIASLPGMTIMFFCELRGQRTNTSAQSEGLRSIVGNEGENRECI
jgi:hypothetical protein